MVRQRQLRFYLKNRFFFRSILLDYRFSPIKDLERNNRSGVIHLANKHLFGLSVGTGRTEKMQQAIVRYFLSRNEDNRRVLRKIRVPRYRVQPAARRRRASFLHSPRRPIRRRTLNTVGY
jgi:hypothetical protein